MAGLAETLAEHRSVTILGVDGVAVVLPKGQPDEEAVRAIDAALRAYAKRRGERLRLLIVVSQSVRPPSPDARTPARAMFAGFEDHVALLATVFEGSGFMTAAKRSVYTFVSGLLRRSVPGRVFPSVPQALAWMERECRARELPAPRSGRLAQLIAEAQDITDVTSGAA